MKTIPGEACNVAHDTDMELDTELDNLLGALSRQGYCISDDALPPSLVASLRQEAQSHTPLMRTAGIGRGADHQIAATIRNDEIFWLEAEEGPVQHWLTWTERLRSAVNRRFLLGLFDYECHFARYDAGGFYRRHRDAFRGQGRRRLTTILYLNPDWNKKDGGELRLYADDDVTMLEEVEPRMGRLVLFFSEEFPHEVLPATRERWSLTGWFRVRENDSPRK